MDIIRIIEDLESLIKNPSQGLPEELFLLVSRITPLVNVDLLIKDQRGQTLLTWRDDGYFPAGWHIPGGIVRYKERLADRIEAVAISELGSKVTFKEVPLAVNEVILPSMRNRAHAVSFLYECLLTGAPNEQLKYHQGSPQPGQWAWYGQCPEDLISVHQMYRRFIG